ncbi:MAG: DUF3014 domain-containing protein [Xanthomonadales bacterium]|nr:DUF3014 domain-containing protein [Xanthomonadales bacterium]MDH4017962.1 DUF3014 domain-containing protein [Xanthomonadales bacterium]
MKKVIPILLLVLLFAGAAWYSFMRPPDPVSELPPPQITSAPPAPVQQTPSPTEIEEVYSVPETEPEPEIPPVPLPVLNESDPEFTQALADIAGPGDLAQYLVMDQVISRLVASIDSLTSRQVPVHINPIKPLEGKFLTEDEGTVLSAQNYARYEPYIALLQSLDAETLMKLYGRYHPLFQQAWEKNGGTGSFNDRLVEVIDNLLQTPDVPGPVLLTKYEAVYLYQDEELEAMTAGQKMLVRMGSANASVIKDKLTELKTEL